MNEQPVAAFERALLKVFVRAVNGVAGLESDDAAPALLGEERARLSRIESMRRELDFAGAIEHGDFAAKVELALVVDGLHTGVSRFGRAIDFLSLALFVGTILLGEVQH